MSRILIKRETSGIAAIARLVGKVLDVVERGLDSDCDGYMIVRNDGNEQLIYDDQCSIVELLSGLNGPENGD